MVIGRFFDKLKTGRFSDNKVASIGLDVLEIVIDTCILLLIFYLLFDMRLVPTESMYPTVKPGDRVFFEKPSVYFNHIDRGDVVMFDATEIASKDEINRVEPNIIEKVLGIRPNKIDYLKRVIAVGGDKVSIKNDVIFINGKKFTPSYKTGKGDGKSIPEVTVPKGYVFVMGDNRGNSWDGRYWDEDGKVSKNKLDGFKAIKGVSFVSTKKIKAVGLFEFNFGDLRLNKLF